MTDLIPTFDRLPNHGQTERLRQLAEFVDTDLRRMVEDGKAELDMGQFWNEDRSHTVTAVGEAPCGTSACLLGWSAHLWPDFIDAHKGIVSFHFTGINLFGASNSSESIFYGPYLFSHEQSSDLDDCLHRLRTVITAAEQSHNEGPTQ